MGDPLPPPPLQTDTVAWNSLRWGDHKRAPAVFINDREKSLVANMLQKNTRSVLRRMQALSETVVVKLQGKVWQVVLKRLVQMIQYF